MLILIISILEENKKKIYIHVSIIIIVVIMTKTETKPISAKLDEIESEIRKLKIMITVNFPKNSFLRAAGSWSDLDTESIKKRIYESREVSLRPKVKL
jgi:hypothetical protein